MPMMRKEQYDAQLLSWMEENGAHEVVIALVREGLAHIAATELLLPETSAPSTAIVPEAAFTALEVGQHFEVPRTANQQTVYNAASRFTKKHRPRRYRAETHRECYRIMRVVDDGPSAFDTTKWPGRPKHYSLAEFKSAASEIALGMRVEVVGATAEQIAAAVAEAEELLAPAVFGYIESSKGWQVRRMA